MPTSKVLGVEPRQSTNKQQCNDQTDQLKKFLTSLVINNRPPQKGWDAALVLEMDCKAAKSNEEAARFSTIIYIELKLGRAQIQR